MIHRVFFNILFESNPFAKQENDQLAPPPSLKIN